MQMFQRLINKYFRSLLRILSDDESLNIPEEVGTLFVTIQAIQRFTLFYKSWGIFNVPYKDLKIKYFTQIVNWFTLSQLLTLLASDVFNMVAMYGWYVYHFSSLILQIVYVFLKKYINQSTQKSIGRFLYFYFTTLHYIVLFPSIQYSSRQIICDRQARIVKNLKNCGLAPQIVNSSLLYILCMYQCFVYAYLYRNITLPVTNFGKKRETPLTFLCMILDFPCLLLQQSMNATIYTINNFVKLALSLSYFIDAWYFRPLQATLNDYFLKCCANLVFNALLLIYQDLIGMDESQMVYTTFAFAPLISHVTGILFENQKDGNSVEEILYWVDKLHFFEELQKKVFLRYVQKDNSYQIKWVNAVLRHKNLCRNPECLSHSAFNLGNFAYTKQQTHSICICRIQTLINQEERKQQKFRVSLEKVYINLITYLSFECNSPLQGYTNMKKYQLKQQNMSIYFQISSEILGKKIQFKSKQIQDISYIHQNQQQDASNKLGAKEIMEADDFWEDIYPKIIAVMDQKVKFWEQLIIGVATMEEFSLMNRRISKRVTDVQTLMNKSIKIDPKEIGKSLSQLNGMQMKILSVIFSLVFNDYYGTLEIEQKLEEISSYERNLQQEVILNINMLNQDVIVILASILKQRGQIVNKNKNMMADFFGFSKAEDFAVIQNILQLMPDMIAKNHNNWIDNYLLRGHSKLFSMAQGTLYIDKDGFVCRANLKLTNLFDTTDDFLMCGSLLKANQQKNFIIMDCWGKILGVSREAMTLFGGQSLQPILDRGYLFFWFAQLIQSLELELTEIQAEENNHLSTTKTGMMYQIFDFSYVAREFEQFSKSSQLFGIQKTSINHSKSALTGKSYDNHSAQLFEAEDDRHNFYLRGHNIPILNKRVQEKLELFQQNIKSQRLDPLNNHQHQLAVKYNISYNVVGSEDSKVSYFTYWIQEVKSTDSMHNQSISVSTIKKSHLSDESDLEINTEDQIIVDMNKPVINKLGSKNFDDQIFVEGPLMVNDLIDININQSSLISPKVEKGFLSSRQERMDQEQMDDKDFMFEENQMDDMKDSSDKEKNSIKRDIAQILHENQEGLNKLDFDARQSQSSASSSKTENSIFQAIKSLQYQLEVPKNLVQIFLINAIICLAIAAFIIVKVILVQNNLLNLKNQMSLIESPNMFNQIYCHFASYTQMFYINHFNITNYNEYEIYRLKNMSAISRKTLGPIIADSKNKFAIYQQNGELTTVHMFRINGLSMLNLQKTFFEFVFYFNQESFQQNKQLQEMPSDTKIRYLLSSYVLRLNILAELDLSRSLLDAVYSTFYGNLSTNEDLYIILMIVEIMILIVITLIQIPFWIQQYVYIQRILLIITRASQKEAEDQIQNQANIQSYLFDFKNKWKHINLHTFYFDGKQIQNQILTQTTKRSSRLIASSRDSRSTLTSRIAEPRFSYKQIYILVGIYTCMSTSFIMGMYFYTHNITEDTKPQLNLSMDFVKFKFDYDNLNLLALTVKTNPYIEEHVKNLGYFDNVRGFPEILKIQETRLTTQLKRIHGTLYQRYDKIYGQILQSSKISAENKQQLLSLYQQDLCDQTKIQLPFCSVAKDGDFPRFPDYPRSDPRDNYRQYLRYGMTGLIEGLMKTITTTYSYEIQHHRYMEISNHSQQFFKSPDFMSLIWSYYIDLYQPFVLFEQSISRSATDILTSDILSNQIVHLLLCGIIIFFVQIIVFLSLKSLLNHTIEAKQSLVNMPFSMLLDQQTANQIKRLNEY